MPLGLHHLSPLPESQRDHLVGGIPLEVDFSGDGLRDEGILFDRGEFERSVVGALHEQPRASGKIRSPKSGISG